ncbi:hypothetical protein BDR26DRAFT_854469 [Obelidium mucronatum]|nr:hypothetical protein BDR26DRAFT_854469 [Obelidium mucronatum]
MVLELLTTQRKHVDPVPQLIVKDGAVDVAAVVAGVAMAVVARVAEEEVELELFAVVETEVPVETVDVADVAVDSSVEAVDVADELIDKDVVLEVAMAVVVVAVKTVDVVVVLEVKVGTGHLLFKHVTPPLHSPQEMTPSHPSLAVPQFNPLAHVFSGHPDPGNSLAFNEIAFWWLETAPPRHLPKRSRVP